jgi:hypothetical protein
MNLREIFLSVKPTNLRLLLATLLQAPALNNRWLEPVKTDRPTTGNNDIKQGQYFPCTGRHDHFEG